jgi:nicotinamide-nucleotide amidase
MDKPRSPEAGSAETLSPILPHEEDAAAAVLKAACEAELRLATAEVARAVCSPRC